MNKIILCLLFMLPGIMANGQYSIRIKIVHKETREPLTKASLALTEYKTNHISDSNGAIFLNNLKPGNLRLRISYAGFEEMDTAVAIPFGEVLELGLMPEEEEEVIVQSTRTSRSIRNAPTRVETIELEEIDEKSNMRPANVSMLLHESTGIQVQQTSATSGNAGIRIQGLDGRYTQLLKDGFASFGNFASGLSVLEIPPLDLKQVEIIKGPASTLYGGGAIAGVVNFISKTPKQEAEHNFLLNQSSIGQSNLAYFSSGRNKKTGYTFLALANRQQAFDVDKDDFTEVPKSLEFTFHPRLFLYAGEKTFFSIGNNFTTGRREGGDVQVIRGKADATHSYFELNKTLRNITTLEMQHKINDKKRLTVKQSFSFFDRKISVPGYDFAGASYNNFTDVSYLINTPKHDVVTGVNVVYDRFNERRFNDRDNNNFTTGAFIQDTWDVSEKLKLETGLRLDWAKYSNSSYSNHEFFALPRVSLLVRYNEQLSSRIGGGMGYKLPTLFTEQAESMQYRNLSQLYNVKSERSYGGTADINWRTSLSESFDFAFNHMFFYSWIDRPLLLQNNGTGTFIFSNASKPVQSKGFETNAKFIFRDEIKLFLGYTFTDAKAKYLTANQFLALVPKHKLNSALIFEREGNFKAGFEAYFTGEQYLNNRTRTPSFWELGIMGEKTFGKISVYVNFENFTDTRQSRFKRVVNDPHNAPTFDDIWTHTEGFVFNGGIKLRL